MFRISLTVCSKGIAKRFASSFSGENAIPSNLRLPSNLVDPARSRRQPPSSNSGLRVLQRCEASVPSHLSPVQTWVDTLVRHESEPLGLVDLHPDVFAVPTRIDILHEVELWQRNYKRISHANTKVRSEVRGGGKKPWNQKGSGRARHGSIRSPIWRGGGVSHGPRGPTSYYYMIPIKNYLHVVDSLNIPTPDPQYLVDLIRYRYCGESVLLVDATDNLPGNILQATAGLKMVNVIPAIGLNVHSMLKHEVLVLTLEAVKFLENKLLWHNHRFTPLYPFKLPYSDLP
ncbi:39S ribosomal protein L4, mitochondrial isoform X2 [Hypomesus transpacificus]|uniref:39S ribosomal protein L4, mitochondrial isoform X2 n=1 Tax=Hypomesus transpacificus TaxID=137520 RepID=UPI001F071D95|nr:39S ribosomal protein L4, mitochondrial isoform X2 [Hypomesus transpacificus]